MKPTYKPTPRDYDMEWLKNYLVTINDFNVQAQIGRGGYGEVYYGIHIKTGRKVAIKKLILSRFDGPDLVYFNREVQILASCDNYFILPLIGYSNSFPYIIVTDYIPCGSLFEALRHKPGSPLLTDTIKTKIGLGIAIGMIALHDKNIIHRDLKSLNILISQETLPRICDFGIGRFTDAGKGPSCPQTLFTANIGTPHWMAPEILQSGHYTDKVDQFSYAVILWEMLTESLPFQGMKDYYQIASKVISGERNPIPLNTPAGLKNLIQKLWSHNPESRPDFREVYKSFASHEVYFGNTNHAEIDEFVKKFPMPEKPSSDEESHFNSDKGINSDGSHNSDLATFEKVQDIDQTKEQPQENEIDTEQSEAESQYIKEVRAKLSNGPSKPVRPSKIIQPVGLNKSVSQEKEISAQTNQIQTEKKESAQTKIQSNQEKNKNENKKENENINQESIQEAINIDANNNADSIEKIQIPPPQYEFLYIGKYLTKDNIFLQYFSENSQPSFLEGFNNDDIIEEEEEEIDFEISENNENLHKSEKEIDQLIVLTSSSDDDDQKYDEMLDDSDTSRIGKFGELSVRFHSIIKNINSSNKRELINIISHLIQMNNESFIFETIFNEITILASTNKEFASLLVQTKILEYLPFNREDFFNNILHIILAILSREPEFITDEIIKKLFTILMKKVNDHKIKIKDETQKDFDEIIEKEENDADYENEFRAAITKELKTEIIPYLCILEKIGANIRYRDSIFELYIKEIDVFINFNQFIDIVFYLSNNFPDFQKLQKNKLLIFSKAISLKYTTEEQLLVVQSGYRSLARLTDAEYSEDEISFDIIIRHLKERFSFTIEALIIISKLKNIPLSDELIEALTIAIKFSEKASFIVSNIALNLASSSPENKEFIYKSKIWLKVLPQHGMKLILYLASEAKYQNEMVEENGMASYLINVFNYASTCEDQTKKADLTLSVISLIRYSKNFHNFVDKYSSARFLHAAIDSTISSNNEKCIDQGLLLFDQLFREGVWLEDFSYFIEKISKAITNMQPKQVQRSIVALLALSVMFPQSRPEMKDNEIAKIISKINVNSSTANYRNNLIQILNQP